MKTTPQRLGLVVLGLVIAGSNVIAFSTHQPSTPAGCDVITARRGFLAQSSAAATALLISSPAQARGRATLEQSYDRYSPRIRAGGAFYATELKQLVVSSDWKGIQNALQEPPKRQKSDLQKADAGVAERARQAGGFSDARVLVAADLFAAAFSESSLSAKTKTMQASVSKLRNVIAEMENVSKQATGEVGSGGLFGLGAKKPDQAAMSKKIRELYVEGGNAWNEYVLAANDSLALKFDKFDFVK